MTVTVLGVRHHGPGSARSVVNALAALRPDAVLVEGPPGGQEILSHALDERMAPPVALIVHVPGRPELAAIFPFAEYSPEWQAIRYGLRAEVPVRLIDLPHTAREQDPGEEGEEPQQPSGLPDDPIQLLAAAGGDPEPERWWDGVVEQRGDDAGVFEAILEAMAALREPWTAPLHERRREAHMRQAVRAAQREGFDRVAVVCGAWHAPAVKPSASSVTADAALLRGLPRLRTSATWIPWTNRRLTFQSGYAAGVRSPGWYQHLWRRRPGGAVPWMVDVARLLRSEDLDASPAQLIDAIRLAVDLAALRSRSEPGLDELSEATLSVLCAGADAPFCLIARRLIVGDVLGEVPPDVPRVPLQEDLEREQRRLRLRPEAGDRGLELDLRVAAHLQTSHLLHRLRLLGIPWGKLGEVRGKRGTFHEQWSLHWEPDYVLRLIDGSRWGTTVAGAAAGGAAERAAGVEDLPSLARLVDIALLADLPPAVAAIMERLAERSALSTDAGELMDAVGPLLRVLRYGSVRRTDTTSIAHAVDGLLTRVCIGLPAACAGLDDDAAAAMAARVASVEMLIARSADAGRLRAWREALGRVMARDDVHGLVAGRVCRLLLDADVIDAGDAFVRLGRAASAAVEPPAVAAWIEGFLSGSGLLLLVNPRLLALVDEWVCGLRDDHFLLILPLLRRTFATYQQGERRQLAEAVAAGAGVVRLGGEDVAIDAARGAEALPVVAALLGVRWP